MTKIRIIEYPKMDSIRRYKVQVKGLFFWKDITTPIYHHNYFLQEIGRQKYHDYQEAHKLYNELKEEAEEARQPSKKIILTDEI